MKKVVLQAKRTLSLVLTGLMVLTAVPAKTVNAEEITVAEEVVVEDAVVDEVAEEAIVEESVIDEVAEEVADDDAGDADFDATGEYNTTLHFAVASEGKYPEYTVSGITVNNTESITGTTDVDVVAGQGHVTKIKISYNPIKDGEDTCQVPNLVLYDTFSGTIKYIKEESSVDSDSPYVVYELSGIKNAAGENLKIEPKDKPIDLTLAYSQDKKKAINTVVVTDKGTSTPVTGDKEVYALSAKKSKDDGYKLEVTTNAGYQPIAIVVNDTFEIPTTPADTYIEKNSKIKWTVPCIIDAIDDTTDDGVAITNSTKVEIKTAEFVNATVTVSSNATGKATNVKLNGETTSGATTQKDVAATLTFDYDDKYDYEIIASCSDEDATPEVYENEVGNYTISNITKAFSLKISATEKTDLIKIDVYAPTEEIAKSVLVAGKKLTGVTSVPGVKYTDASSLEHSKDMTMFKGTVAVPYNDTHAVTFELDENEFALDFAVSVSGNDPTDFVSANKIGDYQTGNVYAAVLTKEAYDTDDTTSVLLYTKDIAAKVKAFKAAGIESITYKDANDDIQKLDQVEYVEVTAADVPSQSATQIPAKAPFVKDSKYKVVYVDAETAKTDASYYPVDADGYIRAYVYVSDIVDGKAAKKAHYAYLASSDMDSLTDDIAKAAKAEGLEAQYLYAYVPGGVSLNDVKINMNTEAGYKELTKEDYGTSKADISDVEAGSTTLAIGDEDTFVIPAAKIVSGNDTDITYTTKPRHFVTVTKNDNSITDVKVVVGSDVTAMDADKDSVKVSVRNEDVVYVSANTSVKDYRFYKGDVKPDNYVASQSDSEDGITQTYTLTYNGARNADIPAFEDDVRRADVNVDLNTVLLNSVEVKGPDNDSRIKYWILGKDLPYVSGNNVDLALENIAADNCKGTATNGEIIYVGPTDTVYFVVDDSSSRNNVPDKFTHMGFDLKDNSVIVSNNNSKIGYKPYYTNFKFDDADDDHKIAGYKCDKELTLPFYSFVSPSSAATLSWTSKINENSSNLVKLEFNVEEPDVNNPIVDKILNYETSDEITYGVRGNGEFVSENILRNAEYNFTINPKYAKAKVSIDWIGVSNASTGAPIAAAVTLDETSGKFTVDGTKFMAANKVSINITPDVDTKDIYLAYNPNAFEAEAVYSYNNSPVDIAPVGTTVKVSTNVTAYKATVIEGENVTFTVKPIDDSKYNKLDTVAKIYYDNSKTSTPSYPNDPDETVTVSATNAVVSVDANKNTVIVLGQELETYTKLFENKGKVDAERDLGDITAETALTLDYATSYTVANAVDTGKATDITLKNVVLTIGDKKVSTTNSNGNITFSLDESMAAKTGTLVYTVVYNKVESEKTYNVTVNDVMTGFDIEGLADGVITQEIGSVVEYAFTATPATAGIGGITITPVGSDKGVKVGKLNDKGIFTIDTDAAKADETATFDVKKGSKKIGQFKVKTIKAIVAKPVMTSTFASDAFIDLAIDIPADLNVTGTSVYEMELYAKESKNASFPSTPVDTFTTVLYTPEDGFIGYHNDARFEWFNGAPLKAPMSYDFKVVLKKVSSNGVIGSAESDVLTVSTREKTVEYKLSLDKIDTNLKVYTNSYGDAWTNKVYVAKLNYSDVTKAKAGYNVFASAVVTSKPAGADNVTATAGVEKINDEYYLWFDAEDLHTTVDAHDEVFGATPLGFGEYEVKVTADNDSETAEKYISSTATIKINVVNKVKGSTGLSASNYYIVKNADVAAKSVALSALYDGKKVAGKFVFDDEVTSDYYGGKLDKDYQNIAKYVTVDEKTGVITVDAAYKFPQGVDTVGVAVKFVPDKNINVYSPAGDKTLRLNLTSKPIGEQVVWTAVVDVNTGKIVSKDSLEINRNYSIIGGDSKAILPVEGKVYNNDWMHVFDLVPTVKKGKTFKTSGTWMWSTAAGSATINLIARDGSAVAADLKTIKVKSTYAKLNGLEVAYQYDSQGNPSSTITANGKGTFDDVYTDGVIFKLIPTDDSDLSQMNLKISVKNGKVLKAYNKNTGYLKVVAKKVNSPIVISVTDKSVKKAKAIKFTLNNADAKNKKAKKAAKQISQPKSNIIYAGLYANNDQTLTLNAKKYKGKTLKLTADYASWTSNKKGVNYDLVVKALLDGKTLEDTAVVDATTGIAEFKLEKNNKLVNGTYKFYVTVLDDNGAVLTKPTAVSIKIAKANDKKGSFKINSNIEMSTVVSAEGERAHVKFEGDYNSAKVVGIYNVNNNGKVNNFTDHFEVANEEGGFYIYVKEGLLKTLDAKDLEGYVRFEVSAGEDSLGNKLPAVPVDVKVTIVRK